MSFRIIITRKQDNLTQEEWFFEQDIHYSNGIRYALKYYYLSKKESTRKRKFKFVKKYDFYDQRNSPLKLEDVPLPDNVVIEVKNKIIKSISISGNYSHD